MQRNFAFLLSTVLILIASTTRAQEVADAPPEVATADASAANDSTTANDSRAADDSNAANQVGADIKYLASDELKGRQPGTPEMKLAEDYIVNSFKASGLTPGGADGTFLQPFDIINRRIAQTINPDTTFLKFKTPDGDVLPITIEEQFVPMAYKETYTLTDLPVVFVGYGIDAQREHYYNDYRDIDVEGKAVVLIRGEPQPNDPNSVFDGDKTSRYSYLQTKVDAAIAAKAAAIIMVNDAGRASDNDDADALAETSQFGRVTNSIPFLHIKRDLLNEILAATPVFTPVGKPLSSIKEVEAEIDATLEPLTQTIPNWRVSLAAEFIQQKTNTSNIIGIIEGRGELAQETVVVGAHYDHLGMGQYGSRSRDAGKAIHNGADDNATGTAAVMELARRLNKRTTDDPQPSMRRIVFICFTAEELGLLGAKHYVENPVVPIQQTVAMVNFDMIGYLRENSLLMYGWDSGSAFETLINDANQNVGLTLVKPPTRFAGSDHMAFNSEKVPNIFLHTGLTGVYHTPDDDFEAINVPGAVKVIDLAEGFVDRLATVQTAPQYVMAPQAKKGVKLGIMIEIDDQSGRLSVVNVVDDSIAEAAGIQSGDQIMSFNGKTNVNSRRRLAREIKRGTGSIVEVILDRDGKAIIVKADLNSTK